jgi:hypothetical protein
MTLREIITNDVSGVFMDINDFAEDVEWYPNGITGMGQTIKAIVSADDLEGTREVHGDGRVLHSGTGTNLRESLILDISTNYEINAVKGGGNRDLDIFKVDGKVYTVKRVMGRDDDMQSVLCIRTRVNTTRRGERRG